MEKRDAQILRVAAELFAQKGYECTSVQDIGEKVGMLKGSLYHYINSKDELLYKILKPSSVYSLKQMETIRNSSDSAPDKISKAIESLVMLFENYYPQICVFLGEKLMGLSEVYRNDLFADQKLYVSLWEDIIDEAKASGEIRNDLNTKAVVYGILGLCNWMYRWYRPEGALSPKEMSRIYCTMALEGLLK